MSHKLAKVIKQSKTHKSNESTSNLARQRLGDRPLCWSSITNMVAGTFIGLIIPIFFAVFMSSNTYATASTLTVSVTSGTDAFVNIPPTAEGKFGETGTTTFGVTTTHAAGYIMTASATALSFTDTEGTNGTVDAVYTINNLTLPSGTSSISPSTFESSSDYKNMWGYKPSKYYNTATSTTVTGNTNYFPAPIGSESVQTLDITNVANPSAANNYDITIGTKLDHTVALGSYTTTITLTAVGNATPYTIYYNSNLGSSGDTVSDMPTSPTTDSATGETVTIASESPHRNTSSNTAYLFAGWCTAAVPIDGYCNSSDTGDANATKYNIASTYTLDQTSDSNELTLYAIWRTDPCYNETNLHNLVTCQVKTTEDNTNETLTERTQTLADMQAVITKPTSDSPYADTSNSGVYLYDSNYFGAANDNPDNSLNIEDVYYFRGTLDNTFASSDEYGGIPSSGDSGYYQNFVRLSDTANGRSSTCWRIVRTTATGGVKMIYNGNWNSSNNTCTNAHGNVAAINTYFNRGTPTTAGEDESFGSNGFIVYVGYNYNSKYAYNNTQYNSLVDNSDLFNNETPSNIRTQTENWYTNTSNLNAYNSNDKLETSAGWCNDRTTLNPPAIGDTTIPYKDTSGSSWQAFGPRIRNVGGGTNKLTLTCPNITGYDMLTTTNGMTYPLAMFTEDEAALAGSGFGHYYDQTGPDVDSELSSNYSRSSYLRTGAYFLLLSPYARESGTSNLNKITVFGVFSEGKSSNMVVYNGVGIRPSISLTSSTTISSGTGTSTDPWVIEP